MLKDIVTIKAGSDLAAIVEAVGVELKRSGSRHVGLCPFHDDRKPSFFVFADGRFKCFGCGFSGDCIDFIQRFHNCDFKEALRILGIEQGKITPKKKSEIRLLKHKRNLVGAFRKWEIEAADEVAILCRCCRKVLGNIQTEEDIDKYGGLHHGLESWQYHLDTLIGSDDEAKIGLYHAGYYN